MTKDKQQLPYHFTSVLSTYRDEPCLLGVGIDIAARKKAEEALLKSTNDLKERVKELNCLYRISEISNNHDLSTSEILQQCVNIIPPSYQYPDVTCARITFENELFQTEKFKVTDWKLQSQIIIQGKSVGEIEVFYTEEKPEEQEGPFLKEERWLIDSMAKVISTATERKKAEYALQESEESYRHLFNNNPALIFIWDLENLKILEINQTAQDEYGYTHEEALKLTVLDLRPTDDHEKIKNFAVRMLNSRKDKARGVWRHLKKNGELMYMDIRSHRIIYNNQKAILSLAENVTEKFLIEEQLKKSYEDIRMLNNHLQTIREEERTSISRELHDELGQQLTALKMDIVWISKKIKDSDTALKERISEATELVDDTVKTIRRINTELRPGILDDLGLFAALEWQAKEFSKRTGITCNINVSSNEPELDKNTIINIFRIFQESLTNVVRYANATKVTAELKTEEKNLIMTISDNGTGFDTGEVKQKKSFGLLGMKERAIAMNGEIKIVSEKGKGTTIELTLPIIS